MKSCWLPYYHADIQANGIVTPCCKYEGKWASNIQDHFAVDRSVFETDKLPVGCKSCEMQNSYREIKTKEYKKLFWLEPIKPKLKTLNVSLDNICSSSCIMCHEEVSTTYGHLTGKFVEKTWDIDSLDEHLDSVVSISILGGEPLQTPKLQSFCSKLKGKSIKQINVLTGLSKIKKRNIDALVDTGIPLNFRVSIDAPWGLNEWIRGCDYNDWLSNLELVRRAGTVNWQVTLGAYNIFALAECLDYLETLIPGRNILPSIVYEPQQCQVKQLPASVKEIVKNKLQRYSLTDYNKDIIATALELLTGTATMPWKDCVASMENIPQLRGNFKTLESFIEYFCQCVD